MWFAVHRSKRSLSCGMELSCIGNMCFIVTLRKVDAATKICVQLEGNDIPELATKSVPFISWCKMSRFSQQFCSFVKSIHLHHCCIRCGLNEERILDVVPREDGARNSG